MTENIDQHEIFLTYFKESGKYYTEASFFTKEQWMYQVFEEVKEMKKNNRLPGLSGEWSGFIYVESKSHPNSYPGLII